MGEEMYMNVVSFYGMVLTNIINRVMVVLSFNVGEINLNT